MSTSPAQSSSASFERRRRDRGSAYRMSWGYPQPVTHFRGSAPRRGNAKGCGSRWPRPRFWRGDHRTCSSKSPRESDRGTAEGEAGLSGGQGSPEQRWRCTALPSGRHTPSAEPTHVYSRSCPPTPAGSKGVASPPPRGQTPPPDRRRSLLKAEYPSSAVRRDCGAIASAVFPVFRLGAYTVLICICRRRALHLSDET